MGSLLPSWIKSIEFYSKSNNKTFRYLICQDADTLQYINNLGCIELNIWQDITQYSYVRGEYCFLEEDCDAAILINALRDKGIEPRWKVNHSDKQSKIRSYARYIPPVKLQS